MVWMGRTSFSPKNDFLDKIFPHFSGLDLRNSWPCTEGNLWEIGKLLERLVLDLSGRGPENPQKGSKGPQTGPKQIPNRSKTDSKQVPGTKKTLNWNVMEFSGPRSGPGNSRNERFSGFLDPGSSSARKRLFVALFRLD